MITLLPNRGDNKDFTSGNMPGEVQEDAQEPDCYKCANFNKETDGNVPSEEPNQTEHAEMMSQTLSVTLPLLWVKPTNSYIKTFH